MGNDGAGAGRVGGKRISASGMLAAKEDAARAASWAGFLNAASDPNTRIASEGMKNMLRDVTERLQRLMGSDSAMARRAAALRREFAPYNSNTGGVYPEGRRPPAALMRRITRMGASLDKLGARAERSFGAKALPAPRVARPAAPVPNRAPSAAQAAAAALAAGRGNFMRGFMTDLKSAQRSQDRQTARTLISAARVKAEQEAAARKIALAEKFRAAVQARRDMKG